MSGAALRELMRATLARGKPFRFCARGDSMSPFIHDGDVLTVAPAAAPRRGDVVAFLDPRNGRLTVHRIVAAAHGGFLIKGDSLRAPDGVMPREALWGSVVRVERDGRAVRFGLGIERAAIAYLSKRDLLRRVTSAFPPRERE